MIYVIISANLFPWKAQEASGVFQRVADYMRENTPELSYQALRNRSGSEQRVHGLMTYHSIAEWDVARAKRATAPRWRAHKPIHQSKEEA